MTDNKANLQQLVTSLNTLTANDAKVTALKDISNNLNALLEELGFVFTTIRQTKLLSALISVLEDNKDAWIKNFPPWLTVISDYIAVRLSIYTQEIFPDSQFSELLKVFKKYLASEGWPIIPFLTHFCGSRQSFTIEDVLKKELRRTSVLEAFSRLAAIHDVWKLKIMEDKQLVLDMVALPIDTIWTRHFARLAQHPEAKTLLPQELFAKASHSTEQECIEICILLCTDNTLSSVKLTPEWILTTVQLFKLLLDTGKSMRGTRLYRTLDFVLPIANLSTVESHKGEVNDSASVKMSWTRCVQEAARALWNLAYVESNRVLIAKHDEGLTMLKTQVLTNDPIVKRNIEGILLMFNPPSVTVEQQNSLPPKGHIMISYNWGNQPIVLRMAKSLKEHGYHIWLDVEQMAGMAEAIEQADVMLMCMSQKYKDSPNCRLEGEYCMNRRMEFVPLMMQEGYKPDGWLGIALGSKLWYDFTNENNWNTKLEALVKAIGKRGRGAASTEISAGPSSSSADTTQNTRKPVATWTIEDVHEWMKAEAIEHHFELFEKHGIAGRALHELKRIHSLQPSNIFPYLEKLRIEKLGDILELSDAINKL